MSTAIARFRTPEGFVVAADRRSYDAISQTIKGEHDQKIFPVEGETIALSLAKDVLIEYSSFQFDFVAEVPKYTSIKGVCGLYQYAAELATRLDLALIASGRPISKHWPNRTNRELETVILLDGYHTGEANQIEIRLYHERPSISRVFVCESDSFIGSRQIVEIFNSREDRRLSGYRYNSPQTLQDAIEAAKKFIWAHCDPISESIDPHTFQSVGRNLNIAIVDPRGFRWVDGFDPQSSSTAP